jgi:hypothetical protein
MQRSLLSIATFALVAAVCSWAGDAVAVQLKDITCEQFLAMDEDQKDNVVYWIDGAEAAVSKKSASAGDIEIGLDAFGRPVAAIETACKADMKASLWEKIKAAF